MPVSLLTPMAHDLGATEGMAGQAISISGLFAVITSLLVATVASRFDRRHVFAVLTAAMVLDHFSVVATFVGGSALLLASLTVGSGHRLRSQPA